VTILSCHSLHHFSTDFNLSKAFAVIVNIEGDIHLDIICKLFADDVKMYATLDVNDDGKGLFDKLKSVEKWCSEWQLSISVKKCAVIHIHSGNTRPVTGPSFDTGGYALPTVDHVKNL